MKQIWAEGWSQRTFCWLNVMGLFSPFEIIGLWPCNAMKKNPAFSHSFSKTGNLPLIRFENVDQATRRNTSKKN